MPQSFDLLSGNYVGIKSHLFRRLQRTAYHLASVPITITLDHPAIVICEHSNLTQTINKTNL
jgi:hypothetical protein